MILPDSIKQRLSEMVNYGKAQRSVPPPPTSTGQTDRQTGEPVGQSSSRPYVLSWCAVGGGSILFGQWGFSAQHGTAKGIAALFSGPPG